MDPPPTPPGAESRREFIGRYGSVDVFLVDPYSLAISKLGRGNTRDKDDVRKLLAAGVLTETELRRLAGIVVPQWVRSSVRADPDRFRENLKEVLRPAD